MNVICEVKNGKRFFKLGMSKKDINALKDFTDFLLSKFDFNAKYARVLEDMNCALTFQKTAMNRKKAATRQQKT
jgi:hypothetical protein